MTTSGGRFDDGRWRSEDGRRGGSRRRRPCALQRIEPLAEASGVRARIERDDQSDDGNDWKCQDYKDPEQYQTDVIHGAPPGRFARPMLTARKPIGNQACQPVDLVEIQAKRFTFAGGIARADGLDRAHHAAVALEQTVGNRDDR